VSENTTWRKEITEELQANKENWDDVISCSAEDDCYALFPD
jgi:hypothetical protein